VSTIARRDDGDKPRHPDGQPKFGRLRWRWVRVVLIVSGGIAAGIVASAAGGIGIGIGAGAAAAEALNIVLPSQKPE
jgi:hypothetical protein